MPVQRDEARKIGRAKAGAETTASKRKSNGNSKQKHTAFAAAFSVSFYGQSSAQTAAAAVEANARKHRQQGDSLPSSSNGYSILYYHSIPLLPLNIHIKSLYIY